MHIETSADARRSRRHAVGGDHAGRTVICVTYNSALYYQIILILPVRLRPKLTFSVPSHVVSLYLDCIVPLGLVKLLRCLPVVDAGNSLLG